MKLFCRDEMQRLEMAAVAAGVPLSQLMENAGAAVAQEVERRCRPVGGKRAVLLCGKGNNGGDGFVCAGLLAERGMACWVVLAQGKPAKTDLAAAAFAALPPAGGRPARGGAGANPPGRWRQRTCSSTACLGSASGGSSPACPHQLLAYGSGLPCLKVSADLPSGVECDTGRVSAGAFRADVTVTFTGKKPANVSYPAKEFCGETVVRQVGVPAALVEGAETRVFETDSLFPRPVAAPAGRPGQQGRHGQAAAGVRQLGHGRGLRYGGPGGPAQRRGTADHRRGGAAVPHPGPGGAPGGVRGAGLGKPPGGERAGAAGRLGQVHRLRHGLRPGAAGGAGVPSGVLPLPAALGGRRRRRQLPQPPPGVSGGAGDPPGAHPSPRGDGPAVRRHHPGNPVRPAGGCPAEGQRKPAPWWR